MNGHFKIIQLNSIESTNAYAWKYLEESNEDAIIFANDQTSGKGYAKNKWFSEPYKNLTCSIIANVRFLPPGKQFIIHQITSLGIISFLKKKITNHKHLKIKWPNDIYYKNDKMAGILVENIINGNTFHKSIVGIGLNLNQEEFPPNIPNPLSLYKLTGKKYNPYQVMEEIAGLFIKNIEKVENNIDVFNNAYIEHLFQYRQEKKYRDTKGNAFKGEIIGIDEYGFLLIKSNNTIKAYDFKQISYLL